MAHRSVVRLRNAAPVRAELVAEPGGLPLGILAGCNLGAFDGFGHRHFAGKRRPQFPEADRLHGGQGWVKVQRGEFARLGDVWVLGPLALRLLRDILLANITVAMQVLGPERKLRPGFVWVPLELTNIHGISALTSVITLTPGTVTAELSRDRKYLLVHCLDIDDPQHMIDDIKRRYEAPLRKVFP